MTDSTCELCLNLLRADTEVDVIALLEQAGYWNDRDAWRYFGDLENNWSTIGNQQSSPDAALVEKLVNSVDARLMGECYVRGLEPDGATAPSSMRAAIAEFFDDTRLEQSPSAGLIKNWPDAKRTEIARSITLAATGAKARGASGNPCFTIVDSGEGQTPDDMPVTLMSLSKTNKLRIPFVQGKFNMGGTGVFKFCGKSNLQLVITRRNPKAIRNMTGEARMWSFTVVRREDPERGRRSSVYTYLAPLWKDESPSKGAVLRFQTDELLLFPQGKEPYARGCKWGTAIKLYEYAATGFKSHILMKDGLLSRVDLLLPDVALPIRFHECREYAGHAGSFETTLTGLSVRLEDDRGNNLEEGFPSSCPLSADGEVMTATIYAFKKGKAETYRKSEGIIFTLNGQTHGHMTPDFFRRKAVGLSYLADSLLIVVDCSKFSGRAREDLFMNSRDRLSRGELRVALEHELEDMLRHHQGLRDLKECRRREETEARLADSKPLEDVLDSILRQAPSLANLFLLGKRATNPFKTKEVQEAEQPFHGQRFPTFFKFKGKEPGHVLERDTHQNMRSRIVFETNAMNDYFSRTTDPGQFSLIRVTSSGPQSVANFVGPNLQNGVATLSIQLPEDAAIGDVLDYTASVIDPSREEAFENRFRVRVKAPAEPSGNPGTRRKPPSEKPGHDRESQSGISLPKIIEVPEEKWGEHQPSFDRFTALRIKDAGVEGENVATEDSATQYDFYINIDNLYLKSEQKPPGANAKLLQARFTFGMVLVGLGLLQEETERRKKETIDEVENEDDNSAADQNIERRVELVTRAISPILLPMIDSLGMLDIQDGDSATAVGEAT